ncbi:MAG: glycosyltransferase family 52 [Anaerorhabdus sp.]
MDNYVVITHYQLLHAICMSLNSRKPTRLYVYSGYLKFSQRKLNNIAGKYNIKEVIVFKDSQIQQSFFEELTKGPEVFEMILAPHFKKIFQSIKKDEDIYIYNELQLSYYYLGTRFNNLIKVEDGYNSFFQERHIHKLVGPFSLLAPYVGKEFPKFQGTNSKKVIISSLSDSQKTELNEDILEKIEVIDFLNLKEKERKKIEELLKLIYSFPKIKTNNNLLVLTQPLANKGYCAPHEQMLFYKEIVDRNIDKYEYIYVKKHPVDTYTYSFLENVKVKILESDFPAEIFEYSDIVFDKVISLGSTTSENIAFKEIEQIYTKKKVKRLDVEYCINKYISNTKFEVNVYLLENSKSIEQIELKNYIINIINVKTIDEIDNNNLGNYNIVLDNYENILKIKEALSHKNIKLADIFSFKISKNNELLDFYNKNQYRIKPSIYTHLFSRKAFLFLAKNKNLSKFSVRALHNCKIELGDKYIFEPSVEEEKGKENKKDNKIINSLEPIEKTLNRKKVVNKKLSLVDKLLCKMKRIKEYCFLGTKKKIKHIYFYWKGLFE